MRDETMTDAPTSDGQTSRETDATEAALRDLDLYLDGALEGPAQRSLEARLKTEPALAEALERLRAERRALAALFDLELRRSPGDGAD